MQITILYFQMVRKCTEMKTESISVDAGCTVGVLISNLGQRHPGLRDITPGLLIAVNEEHAAESRVLAENDVVALMPPFSGG